MEETIEKGEEIWGIDNELVSFDGLQFDRKNQRLVRTSTLECFKGKNPLIIILISISHAQGW